MSPPPYDVDSSRSLRSIIDHFSSHVKAFEALNLKDKLQDLIISHFILEHLDVNLIREWETQSDTSEIPSLTKLFEFLENECKVLAILPRKNNAGTDVKAQGDKSLNHNPNKGANNNNNNNNNFKPNNQFKTQPTTPSEPYKVCKRPGLHNLYFCEQFKK